MSSVVIIDNGGANVASVRFALERLGCTPVLTANPQEIAAASHVVLPGVGAAADAMARLRAQGLDRVIPGLRQPVLGICLGMQLLFESSAEGDTDCLGIIPGRVQRMLAEPLPVPHMGWNQLESLASSPLLAGIAAGDYAYFVHSFAVPLVPQTIVRTDYGQPFTAAVSAGNFHGAQFHPERSAQVGARLLQNFLRMH